MPTNNSQPTLSYLTARRFLAAAAVMGLVSCGTNGAQEGSFSGQAALFPEKPHNFRLSLTDAPNKEIKEVNVNVKYAEMRLEGGGKAARVIVAENLGMVDLLKLQNGVTLPMADMNLPENVTVTQIRLVLDSDENHIIKSDGSRCDLKTPSAQKTGVKFIIHKGITIEKGYSYSIVADFDANKSIVLQGNGGCLLKPVVKLKSASRVVMPPSDNDGGEVVTPAPSPTPNPTPAPEPTPVPEEPSASPTPAPEASPTPAPETTPTPAPEPTPVPENPGSDIDPNETVEPLAGEGDSTQVGDETGFDAGDDSTAPPVIPEEALNIWFKAQ